MTEGEQLEPIAKVIKAADEESWSEDGVELGVVGPKHTGARELWFARFSSDPGVFVPRHFHTSDTIAYCVSGRAVFTIGATGEERLETGPGDWVYVPAGVLHTEETVGDEKAFFVLARDGGGGETTFVDDSAAT